MTSSNSITARKTLFLEVMNTFTVFVFVFCFFVLFFFFLGGGGQNKTLKFLKQEFYSM